MTRRSLILALALCVCAACSSPGWRANPVVHSGVDATELEGPDDAQPESQPTSAPTSQPTSAPTEGDGDA